MLKKMKEIKLDIIAWLNAEQKWWGCQTYIEI
jgi:hypothetical protein